jgi:Zn-dependent peptidase ImmA (M78 family)
MPEDAIERDAEALLAQYAHARGSEIRAPIPIEDIVEKHLKLRIEFDDLHRLFDVPRSGPGRESDIFGAIWLDCGRIVIDESLDPEVRPTMEGRYRFTLAHEGGGHWRLHRDLVRSDRDQKVFFADVPTLICRSSQDMKRLEWQANFYASCLLMPRRLVLAEWAAWQDRLGRAKGRGEVDAVNDALFECVAGPIARRFGVSRTALRIRLEKLGLLLRAEPIQQSMNGVL